ncbi:MutS like protein [Termitomyces sp. J132]|nr:MutS like protein [Termitomyces sp. J132]
MTALSAKYEGNYVIALLEGRGVAREVGMAALDKDTGKVMLVQLADCQTYVKTLHQMHLHPPCLVLVPDTFLSGCDIPSGSSSKRPSAMSLLVQCIQEEFPGVHLEPVARRYWNDSGGLEFILQLCVEDDERAGTVIAVSNKYYALSATCALFKHAEAKMNTRFATGSLRIRYVPVEGTMMIDPDTARNLELVENMTYRKSAHSLFGVLNHTYTAMASRLLRVNLLSPITVQTSIDARLDVVEEFIRTEDRYTEVRDALKAFNKMDFDKLIVSLASQEVRVANTAKVASSRILQMLNLRNVVKNLPLLQKALAGSQSQLLRIIHDLISDERLTKIESLVTANLNEDGAPAKGGIGAVNARVYAVKAHRNRLLDVARETYKENETGFVYTLKKTDLEGELPPGFTNVSVKKGKWVFTSMDLQKMNARMKDALDETLMLSDAIVQDLVVEILTDVGALYKASEAVALVDMLWSFAHSSIIRPEFTGTLAIKSGRHPILETIQSAGTLVPNDVYCDDSSSFQIIHGPNMSGKSTYLKQIGLLTVMAMTGCFVPAEYASFRIHDALLTRLSNDDDLEKSLSTFASEMASSAMIIGLATPNSLVLVDELGRGTSPRDGLGISHAIGEELIALKPFVFFATHFKELTLTLSRQPTVINLHLSVHRSRPSASNFGMTFQYKIVDGTPEDSNHYGLELARLADLPNDVLTEGKRVAEALAALHAKHEEESESSRAAVRRKALLRLRTQLIQAFEHSALPDQELLAYLHRFQDDIAKVFLHMK